MKYAVIDKKNTGDEFIEFYPTQEEAIKQADLDWHHLSESDKKRSHIIAGTMSDDVEDYDIYEIVWDSQEI